MWCRFARVSVLFQEENNNEVAGGGDCSRGIAGGGCVSRNPAGTSTTANDVPNNNCNNGTNVANMAALLQEMRANRAKFNMAASNPLLAGKNTVQLQI